MRYSLALIAMAIFFGAFGYGFSKSKPKIYEASATLLVTPVSIGTSTSTDANGAARNVLDQAAVARSLPVADAASKALNNGVTANELLGGMGVFTSDKSNLMVVSVSSTSNRNALEYVNALANAYVQVQRSSVQDQTNTTLGIINSQLKGVQDQINQLTAKASTETQPALSSLYSQAQSLISQQQQLQIQQASGQAGAAIINPAQLPVVPISPKPLKTALYSAVLGILIGACLIALKEQMKPRIRVAGDIERFAGINAVAAPISHRAQLSVARAGRQAFLALMSAGSDSAKRLVVAGIDATGDAAPLAREVAITAHKARFSTLLISIEQQVGGSFVKSASRHSRHEFQDAVLRVPVENVAVTTKLNFNESGENQGGLLSHLVLEISETTLPIIFSGEFKNFLDAVTKRFDVVVVASAFDASDPATSALAGSTGSVLLTIASGTEVIDLEESVAQISSVGDLRLGAVLTS